MTICCDRGLALRARCVGLVLGAVPTFRACPGRSRSRVRKWLRRPDATLTTTSTGRRSTHLTGVFGHYSEHQSAAHERLELYIAEWWQNPQIGRPWVKSHWWWEPVDTFAWWDPGRRLGRRIIRQPVIEVAAEAPPDGLRLSVPSAFATSACG
jgi:hypothetical protein